MSGIIREIQKYPIEDTDDVTIEMPEGAKVLTAQMQGLHLHLCAFVDPEARTTERRFRVIGTNRSVHVSTYEKLTYIDTYQVTGLFFHVFEVIRGN